jgi:hypothetical protein
MHDCLNWQQYGRFRQVVSSVPYNTKTRLWVPGLRRGGEEIVNRLSSTILHRGVIYPHQVNT